MNGESSDIYYKLGEMHGDLKSVLAEVKKTNGRVTKLESETVPAIDQKVDDINLRLAKYVGMVSAIIFIVQFLGKAIVEKIL